MRDAATVILLRDGQNGPEVFMMRRHIRSDFVGGAYVFPGGTVDPGDAIDESFCAGRTEAGACRLLGVVTNGLAFWVAALRESFEEAGILLAYDQGDHLLDFSDATTAKRFSRFRQALNDGRLSFQEFLRSQNLKLATDRVHYWAHWITPEGQPRRYDTRFFFAIAPENQMAGHDGRELTDSAWIAPHGALAKADSKEWTIILPTRRNLQHLSQFGTACEAESEARRDREIPTILPRVIEDSGGRWILIPGEDTIEPAPGDLTQSEDPTKTVG